VEPSGTVIVGMERFGYDLDVMRHDRLGWRASSTRPAGSTSYTAHIGWIFEPTISQAGQKAPRDALTTGAAGT
jgi:hypothetical protein